MTNLSQFNQTIISFVADLKKIFGEHDKDIMLMEGLCDILKINARLVITNFKIYIMNNPDFVKNINHENVDFFLKQSYNNVMADNSKNIDYVKGLIMKFKEATNKYRDDTKTISSIFNWFKVMIYYALLDDGKDPVAHIKMMCDA